LGGIHKEKAVMKLKILVTGGSGRIGTAVMKVLQDASYEAIDYDVVPPKTRDDRFVKGNLTDLKDLKVAMKGVDAVIHLAAYYYEGIAPDYSSLWDINATGTFNVLEAAVRNKVKKIIYASSICATGINTWMTPNHGIEYLPVDEKHPCRPQNLYGTAKLMGEQLGWMYTSMSDTSFIGLRLATVWFPREEWKDWSFIERFVKDPEVVFNEPSSGSRGWPILKDLVWQYVGVQDVAEAFKLALEKERIKYGIYHIGATDTCSDWDSIKIAKTFYPGVPLMNPVDFLVDRKKTLFDISKAQKELGYIPRFNWREFMRKKNVD